MSILGTLGAGLLGYFGQSSSNKQQNTGSLQRQKLADANNIKFWQMQNKYNTPSSQMARLKAAGLNPALIYGSGQTNTGVAGSIAPSKPAPYNVKNPIDPTQLLIAAQLAQTKAQTGKIKAETNQIDSLVGGKVKDISLKNEINQVKADVAKATSQAQKKNIIASADIKGFQSTIQAEDANMATKGFIKGNYIGTIFTQLGLNPNNPNDQLIIKGLIATLIGSQVFNNLSGAMKNAIQSFSKNITVKNPTFNKIKSNIKTKTIFK
jgi:hypothetical protein